MLHKQRPSRLKEAFKNNTRAAAGAAAAAAAAQGALPAGRCPPFVSVFSFGGDDMSARVRVFSEREAERVADTIPALFLLKSWTTLQPGTSTWLFPEYCLETVRDDVTRNRREWTDVRERGDVMTAAAGVQCEI